MISKSLRAMPRTRAAGSPPPALCAAVLLAVCVAAAGTRTVAAQGQQGTTNERRQPQPAVEPCHHTPARVAVDGDTAATPIPDIRVIDQDGNQRRFYSDLVKGKVVAINFVFTSCTYVCPMQGKNFAQLQASLGERLGRDVHLVSVSTDPVTDTPARLKAWAATFGARPGWTLVTGEKEEMDKLLRALTGDASGQSKHSPVALVGDLDKGAWARTYALAEPERYLRLFAEAARTPAARHEFTAPATGPSPTPPRK